MIRKLLLTVLLLPSIAAAETVESESITTGNREVEAQYAGHFPAVKRRKSVPLAQIQKAFANAKETDTVRFLEHIPNQRVELVVREFMASVVEFADFEHITPENIVLGDRALWKVTVLPDKPNVVVVRAKPKNVGSDTSLVVIGDSGHVYTFRLTSINDESSMIPDVYTQLKAKKPLRVVQKSEKKIQVPQEGAKDASAFFRKVTVDPKQIDFKYDMYGDKSIAPMRVWNDGRFTYFDYGKKQDRMGGEVSIAYLIDNVETPLPKRLAADKTGRIVVNHVGDFSIKKGNKRVCVIYKGEKL